MAHVISDREREKIIELRRLLKTHPIYLRYKKEYLGHASMHDDITAIRFIRARSTIAESLEMITNSMQWRHEEKVDDIWKEKFPQYVPLKNMQGSYIGMFHGFDRLGRGCYFEKSGAFDQVKVNEVTDMKTLVRMHIALNEYIMHYLNRSATNQAGRPIFQLCNVVDLNGLSSKMLSSEVFTYLKLISKIDSDNYPEGLGVFYLINSPWIFSQAWKVIRTFLDDKTATKFKILKGSNEYVPALQAAIDPSMLPEEYGGTCHCKAGAECFAQEVEYERFITSGEFAPRYVTERQLDEKQASQSAMKNNDKSGKDKQQFGNIRRFTETGPMKTEIKRTARSSKKRHTLSADVWDVFDSMPAMDSDFDHSDDDSFHDNTSDVEEERQLHTVLAARQSVIQSKAEARMSMFQQQQQRKAARSVHFEEDATSDSTTVVSLPPKPSHLARRRSSATSQTSEEEDMHEMFKSAFDI